MVVGFILLALLAGAAQTATSDRAALAAGSPVYVEPTPEKKDAAKFMIEQLRKWGRWPVVETRDAATLVVRLQPAGSGGWGVASVEAVLVDAATGATVWTSTKERGFRSAFGGYASPFKRAAIGLVGQMKEASNAWPVVASPAQRP